MDNSLLKLVDIVQQVSHLTSSTEQVNFIVSAVCESIHVDVCSLYRTEKNGDLVLLASQGLTTNHPITIPKGRGLVGQVVTNQRPINIDNAAYDPNYYYVALSEEENFHSFCGVPLVHKGTVIGVLVVQRVKAENLDTQSEAFLVTLATHLAMMIPVAPATSNNVKPVNNHHQGISGAPGIAIGTLWNNHYPSLSEVRESRNSDPKLEIAHWHQLLDQTKVELKAEQLKFGKNISMDISGIFDAYTMLLSDRGLIEKVESDIGAGYSMLWALHQAINHYSTLFYSIEDPYLKARGEDIVNLGNKLYQMWLDDNNDIQHSNNDQSIVLIGPQVSISDIAKIPRERLAAIVCFDGSALSHTAVLANALGIPAIMGIGDIGHIEAGEKVIVDGNSGQIILNATSTIIKEYRQSISSQKQIDKQLSKLRKLPAVTLDGIEIDLFANTGLLADIMPGINNGAGGIGLYRTEIPFMIRSSFPSEDEQVEVYAEVCKSYQGKAVYFRTLDIGGDKQLPYFTISGEENPALGWRGIRFSLDNSQLLMTQLRAIIRASGNEIDLHILIPMVSATEDIDQFKGILEEAIAQLRVEGLNFVKPKVGVMIEVPASISLLQYWKDKIDFISIGSNDLSQYLLALDRNNVRVANRFDHVHPSIINEISRVVNIARQMGIPVSVCGEMASDPVAVILLVGMGIRRLSMSSSKIPKIKYLIRNLSSEIASNFLEQALKLSETKAIRRLGEKLLLGSHLNEIFQYSSITHIEPTKGLPKK